MESEDSPTFLRYRAQYARSGSLAKRFRSIAEDIEAIRADRDELVTALRAGIEHARLHAKPDPGMSIRKMAPWAIAAVALLGRLEPANPPAKAGEDTK